MSSYSGSIPRTNEVSQRPHAFDLVVCNINVSETRSQNLDSLWLAVSLSVGDSPVHTVVKKLGDHGLGGFDPEFKIQNVIVGPDQTIVLTYMLIHNQYGHEDDVVRALEAGTSAVTNAGAKAATEALQAKSDSKITPDVTDAVANSIRFTIGTESLPLIGSALDAVTNSMMRKGLALLNRDCDGPVGAKVEIISGSDIHADAERSHPYSRTDTHPGVEAPGRGVVRSDYSVSWIIVPSHCHSTASTSTSLAAVASGGTSPWVYYIDPDNEIAELIWRNHTWINDTVSKSPRTAPTAPTVRAGSPLTCWNYKSYDPRIFYLDVENNVTGIFRTGMGRQHASSTYVSHLKLGTASANSGLACYGHRDAESRVYYVDKSNGLVELGINGDRWSTNSLPGTPRRDGTPLASFGYDRRYARVYYVDNDGQVNQVAQTGVKWENTILPGIRVHPHSQLSCHSFSKKLGPTIIRVYYIAMDNSINELMWSAGSWSNSVLPGIANSNCSALACHGFKGRDPRVYYVDSQSQVNELAWANGWTRNVLPGSKATVSTSLTCFENNYGVEARVYYVDLNNIINEISWVKGHWESGVVA